jgi:myo-inositol catabolism protein IolC
MEIIEVSNHNELPRDRMVGFICMSPQEAAEQFRKHYQQEVEKVYRVTRKTGKMCLYIPVSEDI